MPAHSGQTALLIFSRTATHEGAAKTFDRRAGRSANRAIAQCLIQQTIATAHRTRFPVFIHYDEQPQPGVFGTHLAEALEGVLQQGYERVLVIGNDCPDISVDLLLDAERRLREHELVLGPALDGGLYLIGMHRAAYQRQGFEALPWETPDLQAGWHDYCSHFQRSADWLAPLSDVDHATDFQNLLVRLPLGSRLRTRLLSILASQPVQSARFFSPFPVSAHLRLTVLRGPPLASFTTSILL